MKSNPTNIISEGASRKLVPELRFPEFLNEGEWVDNKLGDIAEFFKGKGISKLEVVPTGKVPCIRYGELYTTYNEIIDEVKSFTNVPINELFVSKANDIIIPSSGETKEDISTASCVIKDNIALGGDINIIRTKHNGIFLSYYLNNAKKNEIAKIAQGISVIHLYNEQLRTLSISLPILAEQQKIVQCLSSIDELIVATKGKVDYLKEYKRGMMQKLFPAKGKTLPELRFPEFNNEEEWEEEVLGMTYKVQGGFAFKSNEFRTKGVPIIRISNIPNDSLNVDLSNCVFYEDLPNMSNFIVRKGDLVIAMSGATTGKTAKYKEDTMAYLNQRVGIFRSKSSSNKYSFLCQWIQSDHFANQLLRILAAGAQPNISSTDIENITWRYPKNIKEQQKIAFVLSSIDEMIEQYYEKLKALEQHKKGLMQQLFPQQ